MRYWGLLLALLALVACRSATEIDVTVTTDFPCAKGVNSTEVRLGGDDLFDGGVYKVASSTSCEPRANGDNYLGKVVVIPSAGESDRVDMLVVTGINQGADSCIASGFAAGADAGCIVERRSWTFVPHTTLSAGVLMPAACANYPCNGGQTCTVQTDGSPTCSSVPMCEGVCADAGTGPPEAGPDTLPDTEPDAFPDGGIDGPADAAADAPPEVGPADTGVNPADSTVADVDAAPPLFLVGGTVTGLGGDTVVLEDNGGDNLLLMADGTFTFPTPLGSGASYAVTVLAQPTGPTAERCTVAMGMGTVGNADVTSVVVTCMAVIVPPPSTFTIGGMVSGLYGGDTVLLEDNLGDDLFVTTNGAFTFPTPIASGSSYSVTVQANPFVPAAQTCTVAMGAGTVGQGAVTNVTVSCVTSTFTVGGTVTGLSTGGSLVLQDNGGNNLTLTSNGAFAFPSSVASASPYNVTVFAQTSGHSCDVSAGVGNVSAANVTTVVVNCGPGFTVGGAVTGLVGSEAVTLQDNAGAPLVVPGNGSFAFPTPVQTGSTYAVTVTASPSSPVAETCTVTAGSTGMMAGADVTSVVVACTPTAPTVGVTVAGLSAGATATLKDTTGGTSSVLTVAGDGSFTFPGSVASGTTYDVTVVASTLSCTVANGSGTLGTADVTALVTCGPLYTIGGTVSGLLPSDAGTSSVTLFDNDASIIVAANGSFAFPGSAPSGIAYDITVESNPTTPAETCTVANGAGTVGSANVSAQVSCSPAAVYAVGATVTGLAPGDTLELEDNGGSALFVTTDGSYTFFSMAPSGTTYDVTASNPTTPTAETCTVAAASGTVAGADVSVAVTCVPAGFTVGGTVTGLDAGESVVLEDNGADAVTVSANGTFVFGTKLETGQSYEVTVETQPTGATCTVSQGGPATVGTANVTTVGVACAPSTLVMIGTGPGAYGIAVDSTNVYWTAGTGSNGAVLEAPLPGGGATTIASGQATPLGIAIGPTDLYWADQGSSKVWATSLSADSPTFIANSQLSATGVAVANDHIYWTNDGPSGTGSVVSLPIGPGSPFTLASGLNSPIGIAADATSVYWTSAGDGAIAKVPVGGGSVTTLATGQSTSYGIALDAARVYWTSQANGTVMSVPIGGGTTTVVASGQSGPVGIALDATTIYWTNETGGTVMSIPKSGGAASPSTLASGQGGPIGIAVDSTSAYWANMNGSVMQLTPK